jgi:hypothetical protein
MVFQTCHQTVSFQLLRMRQARRTVAPAQSSGALPAELRLAGILTTNAALTRIRVAKPPCVMKPFSNLEPMASTGLSQYCAQSTRRAARQSIAQRRKRAAAREQHLLAVPLAVAALMARSHLETDADAVTWPCACAVRPRLPFASAAPIATPCTPGPAACTTPTISWLCNMSMMSPVIC